jgi:hypothetical protein
MYSYVASGYHRTGYHRKGEEGSCEGVVSLKSSALYGWRRCWLALY